MTVAERDEYRWKLIVEYDGSDFVGWSRQPNQRSVQGAIEGCLEQILQHPIKVSVSGRTDAGGTCLGSGRSVYDP